MQERNYRLDTLYGVTAIKRKRYVTLDGMRGLAAICVACYHFGISNSIFPSGYLAVDLFFALSGFVIALNYTARLKAGLTPVRFIEIRLIRLYPLYILGLALGTVLAFYKLVHLNNILGIPTLLTHFLVGCAILPNPFSQYLFPLNIPSWSLFFEIIVNIAFAVTLVHWRSRFIATLIVLSGVALLFSIKPPMYFDIGASWDAPFGGLLRTFFSFSIGILFARLFPTAIWSKSWLALFPLIALLFVFARSTSRNEWFIEPCIVFILFPLLISFAIRFEPPPGLGKALTFLGDISYAVYVIHVPALSLISSVTYKLHLSATLSEGVYIFTTLFVSTIAVYCFDTPLRRILNQASRLRLLDNPNIISS